MKKAALVLVVLVFCLPLAACKNLEAWLVYERMNEARESLQSEESTIEAWLAVKSDTYNWERIATATKEDVFYTDHVESHVDVRAHDNGELVTYEAWYDGAWGYTNFTHVEEKMKVESVDFAAMVREIDLKYSDEAITKVYVTDYEDGTRMLTVMFDLTLIEPELRDYANEQVLKMALFGAKMTYHTARFDFLVDTDYNLLERWWSEQADIVLEDGTPATYDYLDHTRYTSHNQTPRIRYPSDLDQYEERK